MPFLAVGALILYLVIVVIILKEFYKFVKSTPNGTQNNTYIFPRKQKVLTFCLIACDFILFLAYTVALQLEAGADFWPGFKAAAISCFLGALNLRNLVLLIMLVFLLVQDKKASKP
jgi:hypothetical protein